MTLSDFIPPDPEAHIWDVVVIGAGAGGGTAGFNLARRGNSVLFLERGTALNPLGAPAHAASVTKIPGTVHSIEKRRQLRAQTSAAPPYLAVVSGIGGSTAIFGMIMERFRPIDFRLRANLPLPHDTSAPASWPIQYEDLEPYYREAESLFRVTGADDPLTPTHSSLRSPVTPTREDIFMHDALAQCGLHPYPIHYAREYVPDCGGCPAVACPNGCRNDTARICVLPAVKDHDAKYLPGCTVVRLEARARAVDRAICHYHGRLIAIRGRMFVLALNALLTPALLLRSSNDSFPYGLGNSSGNVGHNLMLHVSDSLAVRFRAHESLSNAALRRGVSLNDFYVSGKSKLGNVHAHAVGLPLTQDATGRPVRQQVVFNTIVEDFPYADNFVAPKRGSETDVFWKYRYRRELRSRSAMLRRKFARALAPLCEVVAETPLGSLNVAHMCGTCRFGNDPASSVLDRFNRIHDVDNVYVVDGSFFPSSSGINPSLTIVANSLRVTTHIAGR